MFAVAAVGGSCDSMEGRTGGSLVVVVDEDDLAEGTEITMIEVCIIRPTIYSPCIV